MQFYQPAIVQLRRLCSSAQPKVTVQFCQLAIGALARRGAEDDVARSNQRVPPRRVACKPTHQSKEFYPLLQTHTPIKRSLTPLLQTHAPINTNKKGVKLLHYTIWIRDVFWLGPIFLIFFRLDSRRVLVGSKTSLKFSFCSILIHTVMCDRLAWEVDLGHHTNLQDIKMQDTKCKIKNTRYKMQDATCKIQKARYNNMQDTTDTKNRM